MTNYEKKDFTKDKEYYINTDITYAVDGLTVKGTYGTATAKKLDDTLYTADDEAENANNVEGTVAAYGLKHNHKQVINSQAAGILQPTDWMVVREAEGGTAVPSDIATERSNLRTECATKEAEINAKTTKAQVVDYALPNLI